jgi:hypothetical protein
MKQGFGYALAVIVAVLVVVILFQQRKLSELRNINAGLRGDTRALITTRNTEGAAADELQRELRQVRAENEQLRKQVEGRTAVRGPSEE